MITSNSVRTQLCTLTLGLCLLTGCAASRPRLSSPTNVVVESSESIEIAQPNARIAQAVAAGEKWPMSPLRTTIELLGDDTELRVVGLDEQKNRGEGADTTVVTMIQDGSQNDSVRGIWQRIVYHRLRDGTWRVAELRRATRCWRGERLESYGAKPCP